MLTNRIIEKLREDFAGQAHESWSGWMRYVFTKGNMNDDESFTIDAGSVKRWIRQIHTPYDELSEQEKDSDRTEAEKYLEILFKNEGVLEKHADDYVKIKGFWRKPNDEQSVE